MWDRYMFIKNGFIAARVWIRMMKISLVIQQIKKNQDARIKKAKSFQELQRMINCLKKKFRIYSFRFGGTDKRIRHLNRNAMAFTVNSSITFLEVRAALLLKGFIMKTSFIFSVIDCVQYTIGVIMRVQLQYRSHFISYQNRL